MIVLLKVVNATFWSGLHYFDKTGENCIIFRPVSHDIFIIF